MLLNVWGPVNTWKESTGGGQARERQVRERILRERLLKSTEKERKELDALVLSLREDAEPAKDIVVQAGDTEVVMDAIPKPTPPESLFAPPIQKIEDEVEREIAMLIRTETLNKFKLQLADYQKQVEDAEAGLATFIILAMDDD